jgi:hypothetical protein
MMTNPDFRKVWRGPRGMRAGIRACEQAKCVVSALTLVYSAVDALAALTRQRHKVRATRKEFLDWVDTYLVPELRLGLTSLDIYAARCGIVHTYGPASDLARAGQAILIVYKWRRGHRPDDPVLEERSRTAKVIEIETLIESLDRAVDRFESAIDEDSILRARVESNIKDLLCYQPWHPVSVAAVA